MTNADGQDNHLFQVLVHTAAAREIRQAARTFRLKLHRLLAADPKVEYGEILCIDVDPQNGDLVVTEQGESGNNTWRIKIIKEV